MKKWINGLIAIIIIILAVIYGTIPSDLIISKVIPVRSSQNEVSRVFTHENRWHGWWPKDGNVEQPPFFKYKGFTYHLSQKFYNSVEVTISGNDFLDSSRINIIKITNDSTLVQWKSGMTASRNPLTRVMQYRKAVRVKENMNDLLGSFKSFIENNENIYGVRIEQIISKDSTLLSTNKILDAYPTTTQIYELIDSIKVHIARQGGKENNFPMLSVRSLPKQKFETIVAIPVNGKLNETPTIVNKRFVPWKTLTGDVKGGAKSVENALIEMQIYIDDHQRNAMGIPFQSLITDRRLESDTLKWVTKICQAVS